MSKWYEVKVTTVRVMLVEIEDDMPDDEARESAMFEALSEAGTDGVSEAEIESGPYASENRELESLRRHADEVLPL
jgi:hypothetical protein